MQIHGLSSRYNNVVVHNCITTLFWNKAIKFQFPYVLCYDACRNISSTISRKCSLFAQNRSYCFRLAYSLSYVQRLWPRKSGLHTLHLRLVTSWREILSHVKKLQVCVSTHESAYSFCFFHRPIHNKPTSAINFSSRAQYRGFNLGLQVSHSPQACENVELVDHVCVSQFPFPDITQTGN